MTKLVGQAILYVALCVVSGVVARSEFTIKSQPITLRYGEVYNAIQKPIPIPDSVTEKFADTSMAITDFSVEMYREVDGTKAPLYEVYNHHYIIYMGDNESMQYVYDDLKDNDPLHPTHHNHDAFHPMDPGSLREMLKGSKWEDDYQITVFGGASGAEFRHNDHIYPDPYRFIITNPEYIDLVFHTISQSQEIRPKELPLGEERLFECPCSPQRDIDIKNGTIDGDDPLPFNCNEEMMEEGNPSCSLSTYVGGYRCCEHGVFLMDIEGQDISTWETTTIYFELTFGYEAVEDDARPLYQATCCDATGDQDLNYGGFANIEYDIPKCTDDECIHTARSIQAVSAYGEDHEDEMVELVYAAAHLHVGAIDLQLIDVETQEVLCHAIPLYGKGTTAGDENGFLVGIEPCVFDPPLEMKRSRLLETIARYDSSVHRTGVMSLWLMSMADAADTE